MFNSKFLYLALLLIFISCEEQAHTLDDTDLSLSVDTISFDVVRGITYKVPPLMGGSKFLYLGHNNGYSFDYNFIRASKFSNNQYYISSGNIISQFHDYIDSTIAIDSVKLTLNFVEDSINTNTSFALRYFPNVPDSVFSRNNTNYLNFNSNFSDIISYGTIIQDTSSSMLVFNIDTVHFKHFTDTTISSFNNTFAISVENNDNNFFKFYSANNGQSTVSNLSVYFKHFASDTLTIDTLNTHNIIDDLTILTPPDLNGIDTTSLSISLAKGLKSLITVDTKSWNIPAGSVFRKAELIFNSVNQDSNESSIINSYLLTSLEFPNSFFSFTEETFAYDLTNGSSAAIKDNALKFNHRSALKKSLSENNSFHTFNIQPNVDVDPFKIIRFYGIENSQFHPKLRITYVLP
tara:strand:- start:202 stop:1419 length:1218 start_codon:yes stop_codon:yes gene_type:complete